MAKGEREGEGEVNLTNGCCCVYGWGRKEGSRERQRQKEQKKGRVDHQLDG